MQRRTNVLCGSSRLFGVSLTLLIRLPDAFVSFHDDLRKIIRHLLLDFENSLALHFIEESATEIHFIRTIFEC